MSYKYTTKGCIERRCPCRLWIQCKYYNEQKYKINRDEIYKEIMEWYTDHFHIDWKLCGDVANG